MENKFQYICEIFWRILYWFLLTLSLFVWSAILFVLLSNLYELYLTNPRSVSWESEVRLSILILAAFFGTPFLVWRTWIASKQAQTAQEKSYAEMFSKSIEQLGSEKPAFEEGEDKNGNPITRETHIPNIEIRIGAIYALGRIMKDSDKDAPAIIDTLATYVKHNCGEEKLFNIQMPNENDFDKLTDWLKAINNTVDAMKEKIKVFEDKKPSNRADIQTALRIIGSRPEKYKAPYNRPDLSNVNFQGAKLNNFDLSYCNLNGAQMQCSDLHGANLFCTSLDKAALSGASLVEANLQKATMHDTNMQCVVMHNVQLQNAQMHGSQLQRASMLSSKMKGAILSRVCLQEGDLKSAHMKGIVMQNAKMQGVDLTGANMEGAILTSANFQGAILLSVKLERAQMICMDLRGAILSLTNLHRVLIFNAELDGANMEAAEIDDMIITDGSKIATSVISVDFTKAVYDFEELQEQLPDMYGHKTLTILPEGMKTPDHWSEADMDTVEGWEQYEREWEAFKKEKGVG